MPLRRKAGVSHRTCPHRSVLAADKLLAIKLLCECHQGRLDDTTPQTQDQVQSGLCNAKVSALSGSSNIAKQHTFMLFVRQHMEMVHRRHTRFSAPPEHRKINHGMKHP